MFTELVRIGCGFPARCGGPAKYQICLIYFTNPPQLMIMTEALPTWKTSCLESMFCHSHFHACPKLLLYCRGNTY